MFSIGQWVVYGGEGVCRVDGIGIPQLEGADPRRLYYTLTPLLRAGQVMTPVDTRVLMRPVMSAEEAAQLLRRLPELEPEEAPAGTSRAIKEYCHALVMSYDCERLTRFLLAAGRRRTEALQRGKKVSQLDERYARRACEHLYAELGTALGLPPRQMPDYIRQTFPDWPEL